MNTLDLIEAARFLKADEETIREKAAAGEIPGAKIGRKWVFLDVDLAEYLRSQYGAQREEKACRSTRGKDRQSGGLSSVSTESEYRKALGLTTEGAQKSSKRGLKLVSTTSKD